MKRLALIPIVIAALALTACQQEAQLDVTARPFIPLDQMDSGFPMEESPTARRSDSSMTSHRDDPADPTAGEIETASDSTDEQLSPAGARTYVVKKGDTLYAIARSVYSDHAKWRDIWNANRDRVTNKDQLVIGQELLLP